MTNLKFQATFWRRLLWGSGRGGIFSVRMRKQELLPAPLMIGWEEPTSKPQPMELRLGLDSEWPLGKPNRHVERRWPELLA